ncbi:trypco2 family protein [Streptomyces pseudogriseolus]|uniref:trypco2 family protein n=1 Tax=Streptomyces pseudogriseolus TaxID=36817 RepID=UPI00347FD01C
MGQEQDALELGEAIEAVRRSLEWATSQGEGHGIRFLAESVQLEFAVELRRSGSAGGGVKAWVASAEGRSERGATHSQRVTVNLTVKDGMPISSRGRSIFGSGLVAGDDELAG